MNDRRRNAKKNIGRQTGWNKSKRKTEEKVDSIEEDIGRPGTGGCKRLKGD